jgi:hypothetical protein
MGLKLIIELTLFLLLDSSSYNLFADHLNFIHTLVYCPFQLCLYFKIQNNLAIVKIIKTTILPLSITMYIALQQI